MVIGKSVFDVLENLITDDVWCTEKRLGISDEISNLANRNIWHLMIMTSININIIIYYENRWKN